MSVPPLPPSGQFLASIRSSCRSLRQGANIAIQRQSIERLLRSDAFTTSFKRVSAANGLALPLNFPSTLAELNLISILSLLNFGSGYRVPLHIETGRGAWDNIRAFAFSLYLTSSVGEEGDLLSAEGMHTISEGKVAELMRVNVHVERPHESIPGVTVGELAGPMYDLVKLVTTTLNETGGILVKTGYPNLGSFVVEALEEGGKVQSTESGDEGVEVVLERLVRAIPAFCDMSIVENQPVYCFKKALFLIHAISVRFGSISPPPFNTPSSSQLPIFADNVIPTVLIHLGVIDISGSSHLLDIPFAVDHKSLLEARSTSIDHKPSKEIPKEGPILTVDQAFLLRAAAIDACEMIIEVAHSLDTSVDDELQWINTITLPELDMWIWAVAKDRPDYRKLERFVLRDTIFF